MDNHSIESVQSNKDERRKIKKNLKATWPQVLITFAAPLIIAFAFRWIVFEPYVIPSGSMIPTLLIHDHIVVNKWVYGWRWPFSESWLTFWNLPKPGDVVVFKYPKSKDTYFIKRVVAVEGDEISVINGQLILNGLPISRNKINNKAEILNLNANLDLDQFEYFKESLGQNHFISRSFSENQTTPYNTFKIPPGYFFVVGDNRDESSDSRVWGLVPFKNLMGKAWFIWLSCENTLATNPMICDPNTLRWNRFFKLIN